MLMLSRKLNEKIDLIATRHIEPGEHVSITIVGIRRSLVKTGMDLVKTGIDTSLNYQVHRREVAEKLGKGDINNYIQQIKDSYQTFEQGAGI